MPYRFPPLGLYIHIPWCLKKCPYCDFNSHQLEPQLHHSAPQLYIDYTQALLQELTLVSSEYKNRSIKSIFFGGGTPSLMPPELIGKLLERIDALFNCSWPMEVTLEANPGTVEMKYFRGFSDAGINRLSLGVQSFNHAHLKSLGRIHNGDEAKEACISAMKCFPEVNFDLMYALPHQTLENALADLKTALSLVPTHLSCYQLTLEPNTLFSRWPPSLPDDELCADMQEEIEQHLYQAGYRHYETSAFALQDHICEHNLNYWQFGDYLGIGAGAHSKLTKYNGCGELQVTRQMRWKHPNDYLRHIAKNEPIQEQIEIDNITCAQEFLMNALRLNEGFSSELFLERTGQDIACVMPALQAMVKADLLGIQSDHDQAMLIKPTKRGQRFLNVMLRDFIL